MSDPTSTASDIDAIRDQFIAQFAEDESATDETPPAGPEVVAQESASEAAPEAEPQAEAAAPEAKTSEARAYRQLLAREAKLREDAKALAADRAAVEEYKRTQATIKRNPVAHLKAAGLSTEEILDALREAQIEDLGDLAPPEAKQALAMRKLGRVEQTVEERIKAAEEAAEAARVQREAQSFVAQYQAGIETFVGSGLSAYPELAAVHAAGKPVAQAIYQTAIEMSQANPTGPAPSYADVAAELNRQLAELASVVKAPSPIESGAATAPTAKGKPVLRTSSTQAQPSPASEPTSESYAEYRERLRQRVLAAHGITTDRG